MMRIRSGLLVCSLAWLTSAPAQGTTAVSNLAESLGFEMTADGAHFAAASSFTTGGSAYQLVSITVSVFTNTTGTSELRLRADSAGVPGALIESLGSQTLPSNQGNVLLTFNSSATPTLSPNTTYWVTLGETGSGSFQWDGTFSTAETSPASWTIGNQSKSRGSGTAVWGEVFGATQESGKFAVEATATPTTPSDLAVADQQKHAIIGIVSATGNRTVLSGCADAGCTSTVGSGPPLDKPDGLTRRADGSLVAGDDAAGAVFAIDPVTGNRTVISGCADELCSSFVGTGITLVDPVHAIVAGSSLLLSDFRGGDGDGAVLSVDPVTGNRSVLSGCANDACSSLVGTGRGFYGPGALLRNASGQLFVVDRPSLGAGPKAVFLVDPATGNRTVLSGCVEEDCTVIAGSGVQFVYPTGASILADGSLVVADTDLQAVVRVDPVTGNRSVVSGCTATPGCGTVIGVGPTLTAPIWVQVATDGGLIVTSGIARVYRVNPLTGNRLLLSGGGVGTGPDLGIPIGVVELPEPGLLAGAAGVAAILALLRFRRRGRAASR
jgi:hypothetical protein